MNEILKTFFYISETISKFRMRLSGSELVSLSLLCLLVSSAVAQYQYYDDEQVRHDHQGGHQIHHDHLGWPSQGCYCPHIETSATNY